MLFEGGGDFIREMRSEVSRYLADEQTRATGNIRLYAKTFLAIGLMVVSWTVLVVAHGQAALIAPSLAGLALGAILTAVCVQHDANHGAHFRRSRYNHLLGWTADVFLGFSSYAWRVKHNVAHHTYTNIDGYDEDATQVPFARFAPSQQPRPWYRLQQYYIWPMYTLMVVRLQTIGDLVAFVRGHVGHTTLHPPRGWDLVGLVIGKAIFVGWALVVPLLFYPWWAVLAAYLGLTMMLSLVMATTFQLAHCVEEVNFTSPQELIGAKQVWAVHEVETTVDFCTSNRVLTWLLGGLNFQIEHHLFPGIPHTHYPAIARIVRRSCSAHGVRYTSQPSLRAALRSHYVHLRRMGRLGVPVPIEMG